MNREKDSDFKHPYDTPLTSALRFLVEVLAWISGAQFAALYSGWMVVPVLIVLMGVPAVFSTPRDKKMVVVATPGPVRFLIELWLYATAFVCSWLIWSMWAAIVVTLIIIVNLILGMLRLKWLLRGAPPRTD